jgi:hypothetical protein
MSTLLSRLYLTRFKIKCYKCDFEYNSKTSDVNWVPIFYPHVEITNHVCQNCRQYLRVYWFAIDSSSYNAISHSFCLHNDVKSLITNFNRFLNSVSDSTKQGFRRNIDKLISDLPRFAKNQELELYLKLL